MVVGHEGRNRVGVLLGDGPTTRGRAWRGDLLVNVRLLGRVPRVVEEPFTEI